jgi:hypothetical protein
MRVCVGEGPTDSPWTPQCAAVLSCAGARCQLGRQPWAYTFADAALSAFSAALFASIVQGWAGAAKQLGAPPPQLNRCGCVSTVYQPSVLLLQLYVLLRSTNRVAGAVHLPALCCDECHLQLCKVKQLGQCPLLWPL